jgi:Protein of unknown function (DUF3035)
MKIIEKITVGTAVCILLAACSETSVMNKLGMGKSPPDESQVVTNNSLAMPPDLQLRQPSADAAAALPANPQAGQAVTATPPDSFAAASAEPPVTTEVASADQSSYDTGAQQLTTDGSISTASTPTTGPAVQGTQKRDMSPSNTREDAYQRFGISKARPDGTPKTRSELDRELLEAVRQEKRKQNPNYGTVFNMGELFKRN